MQLKKINLFLLLAVLSVSIVSCKKKDKDENKDVIVNINEKSNFNLITKHPWELESIIVNNSGVITNGLLGVQECLLDDHYTFGEDYIFSVDTGMVACMTDTTVVIGDSTTYIPPSLWYFADDEHIIVIDEHDYDLLGLSKSTLMFRKGSGDSHTTFTYSSPF